MSARQKLKIAYGIDRKDTEAVKDYRVISVTNSTAYHPGQIIDKSEVDELCKMASWDVTVVSSSGAGG